MEKKYAIINGGLMVFRFDSLTPVTNLEVILKNERKWRPVSDYEMDMGLKPFVDDIVSEKQALQKAINLGITEEEFYN